VVEDFLSVIFLACTGALTRGGGGGIEQPGSKADHSSPSSAEVNYAWNYASSPLIYLRKWCLIKQWIYLRRVVLR
jgi:hypothetical protein